MKAAQYQKLFILFLYLIGIQSTVLASNTECYNINMLYSTDTFITKWTTSTDNTQITFPLYFSSGTLTIDWGDGTTEANLGQAPTHTYATAGTYTVTILDGHIDRIRFTLASSSAPYIVDLLQWGTNAWASTENAFSNCINLDVTASDAPNLSNASRTPGMFFGCSSLVGTAAFNTWDTSTISDMYGMFGQCISFNQDLNNWDVSNVQEMRLLFYGATVFNGNISTWNVSSAVLMNSMFSFATAFNRSLNNWNVSNVTDMSNMFREAKAFNQPLNNWDVSNVDNMQAMFIRTENFNQPLNNWDVSNVNNISYMFFEAEAFNQPLNNWDVSNVTDMASMFESCQTFDQNIGNWDISSVVSPNNWDGLNNMFASAGISRVNYDNTLIGWNRLDPGETQIPTDIQFNGGNSNYCLSETARQELINTYNWTINDGNLSCPSTNVIVPNVVGVSQTDAETTLINGGLQVVVTAISSPTIPAGTVISQDPISGTSVAYGSIVNIEVSSGPALMITGIVSNTSDFLHVIELYAVQDIPDLSLYAIGVDNNNDGSDGPEYYLSGSAIAGDFLYLTLYSNTFQDFFGFAPDFDLNGNNGLNPSGNDAVELLYDDTNTQVLIDSYGNVGVNGNGTAWEYNKSWVYRKTGTGPDGGFVIGNWRIPGSNIIIDNDAANAVLPVPFPVGTYGQAYDDIPPVAVCQDILFEVNQGNNTVDASLIDNGSSDNIGVTFMKLDDAFYNCTEEGANPVTFTVYDAAGNKDTCTATINVTLAPSQVICQDITVNLGFSGQTNVTFSDIRSSIEGACVSEGAQFFVSTTNPDGGNANGLFDGATTTNNPTDDVMGDGNAIYYEEFSFTVPEDGNYLPNFNFSSSTTDDLLFAFISDQPVAPNTGDVTSRPGFLNGFVYVAPSNYLGSFNGDDDVALTAGTTYYLQVAIINQDDSSLLSTATYSGGFGDSINYIDDYTYTTADIGDNTLYAILIDDLGRMSSCAATVTVENVDPFITTWKTDNAGTSNDNQILLPTVPGGSYNFDVDWGDGSIDYGVGSSNIVHTYATAGTYTVKITGNFPRMHFNSGGDAAKLLTIESWGNIKWSSMQGAFFGCTNLDVTATDTPDLSNVTDMSLMFSSCTSLVGTTAFGSWDVSTIQNMSNTFSGTHAFNQNISTWNTANVTDMTSMFSYAINFNGDVSNWDVGEVLTMNYMFENTPLDQNLSTWNTSNVTQMTGMFLNATSFDQDVSAWDITNITTMSNMFDGAALSKENYDNTLIGWHTDSSGVASDGIDDVPTDVTFHGGNSQYCLAETEREDLISTYTWVITADGGKACPKLRVKVYLQGPSLNNGGGLLNQMRDDLRVASLLPTTSPYPDAVTVDPTIFTDFDDEEAVVDWIWLELRDATDNTNIVFGGSFLLDRLGNVFNTILSGMEFKLPDGDYYVVLKHRNHLGIMSATPITLSGTTIATIDFSDGTTPTYGSNAQTTFGMPGGLYGMWAGNANNDTMIQYSGVNPDTPNILSAVLNDSGNFLNFPTFTISGYTNQDINMDGNTQYSGTNPDTPIILQNALAHPGNFLNFSTYQIIEQLPEND